MSNMLAGKVVLVTGGSRGLGAATAAAFANNGADVVITYLASEEKALSVVEKLEAKGVRAAAIAIQGRRIDDPEIDNAAMDRQWAVNTAGVIANIRAAAKVLPDGGRIISVGSGLGTRVLFLGTADYAATKAAIVGYSRGVARDLGSRNITVNVVQSGIMDTDMAAGSKDNLPPNVMDAHAIRRFATVQEVAAAIVFLAGPDAGYITGSIIDVNGGYTV